MVTTLPKDETIFLAFDQKVGVWLFIVCWSTKYILYMEVASSDNGGEFLGGGFGTQVSKTQVRLENIIARTRLFFNLSPR